ncbi:hypothetical protein GCK72_021501 [Caenorhabditis remanei]|uniref:F-box domain-containing protein n=1 Tax=Caenorhabditis remanei TaxID=31234 RepID=A0A6A5GK07_CAERE|nr:hypothetical protein GCK72_021501 [Caenorhabditis remanei]KAF1754936.1 hypothetical protein GCK72_021501 [Caenorhabditis remanei]
MNTTPFPLLFLPEKSLILTLQCMESHELIAVSILSKTMQKLTLSVIPQAQKSFITFFNYTEIMIGFGLTNFIKFIFYDDKAPKYIYVEIWKDTEHHRLQWFNHRISTQQWIKHVFKVTKVNTVTDIRFVENCERFTADIVRSILPTGNATCIDSKLPHDKCEVVTYNFGRFIAC